MRRLLGRRASKPPGSSGVADGKSPFPSAHNVAETEEGEDASESTSTSDQSRGRQPRVADASSFGCMRLPSFLCRGKMPRSPSPLVAAADRRHSRERYLGSAARADSAASFLTTGSQRQRAGSAARSRILQRSSVTKQADECQQDVGLGGAASSSSTACSQAASSSASVASACASSSGPLSAFPSAPASADEADPEEAPRSDSKAAAAAAAAEAVASVVETGEEVSPRRRRMIKELNRCRMLLLEDNRADDAIAVDSPLASPAQDSLAVPSPRDLPSPDALCFLDDKAAPSPLQQLADRHYQSRQHKGIFFRNPQLQESPYQWHHRLRSPASTVSCSSSGPRRTRSKSKGSLLQDAAVPRGKRPASVTSASTKASPSTTSPFPDTCSHSTSSPRGSSLQEAQLLLADMFTPFEQRSGSNLYCHRGSSPSPSSCGLQDSVDTLSEASQRPRRDSAPVIGNHESMCEDDVRLSHRRASAASAAALQPLNGCMPHFPAAECSPSQGGRSPGQGGSARRSMIHYLNSPGMRSPVGTDAGASVVTAEAPRLDIDAATNVDCEISTPCTPMLPGRLRRSTSKLSVGGGLPRLPRPMASPSTLSTCSVEAPRRARTLPSNLPIDCDLQFIAASSVTSETDDIERTPVALQDSEATNDDNIAHARSLSSASNGKKTTRKRMTSGKLAALSGGRRASKSVGKSTRNRSLASDGSIDVCVAAEEHSLACCSPFVLNAATPPLHGAMSPLASPSSPETPVAAQALLAVAPPPAAWATSEAASVASDADETSLQEVSDVDVAEVHRGECSKAPRPRSKRRVRSLRDVSSQRLPREDSWV